MKYSLPLLALTTATYAAVLPRQSTPCTFVMVALGSPNGTILESTIGETRIGGEYPQAVYSINAKVLTDSEGHNCSISSTTAQFQCSEGSAVTLFTLGDNGDLLYDDTNQDWLACPADGPDDDGSWNVFTQAKTNTTGCATVQLLTGSFSCAALGRPSSSSSSAVATDSATAAATSISFPTITLANAAASSTASTSSVAASCLTNIDSGAFEYPHLIIPTSSEAPDYAFGNSYTAIISSTNNTLYNFDVPTTYTSTSTCALIFLFPYSSATQAGTYDFTGIEEETEEDGGIAFSLLDGVATNATTFANTPTVTETYTTTQIIPGNNYTVATFPCPAGETVSFGAGSVGGVGLEYFEDSAPSAIGLYLVPCV